MIRFLLCSLAFVASAVVASAAPAEEPERIELDANPEVPVRMLWLEEAWRLGENDNDPLLGAVTRVDRNADGTVYLLDAQLCQVLAVAPTGELLQTYFSEGDGPGQVRRPADLLLLDDGGVGVVQRIPGKIVVVDAAGDPLDTIVVGGDDPQVGGYRLTTEVGRRGGTFVICGEQNSRGRMTQFLALCDPAGRELERLYARARSVNFRDPKYVERDEDFVTRGRWALGPDGRIHLAPERDRYEIHTYSPEGVPERVVTRPYTARARTDAQKRRLAESIVMMIDGRRSPIPSEIEDDFPAILELNVMDSGEMWVLGSRGSYEQPDGVLQTFDVLGADGGFRERVAVICEADAQRDRLFVLGPEAFVLVREYHSALAALRGGSNEDEALEAVPLSVSLFRPARRE